MSMDEMEEIDSSDDGRIRIFRVGRIGNDETPDTPEIIAWKRLYGYKVNDQCCGNCNFWETDHWNDAWCNSIAKDCNVKRPYSPSTGWCEKWAPNCTTEQWKRKNHYNGYQISYVMVGEANPHPRPTEKYNCTTCPSHYDEHDPEKYPSLAEFKGCRVAEEDTARHFMTTAKDVCELHPDTEEMKGGE
ncbi:MAG: hypothetical protein Q7S53_00730 [bacterium]|nr:hypothetical protein [bacterium]